MQAPKASQGEALVGATGAVHVVSPTPGVVRVRLNGHVTADLVPGVLAALDRLRGRRNDYFFDAWELTSYDSALRTDLTKWFVRHNDSIRSLHTVTQSKLVKMGITVANVVLGVITDHTDRRAFDAALDRAITTATKV